MSIHDLRRLAAPVGALVVLGTGLALWSQTAARKRGARRREVHSLLQSTSA